MYAMPIPIKRHPSYQWEIIQGRLVGKLLVPPLPRLRSREERPKQHEQPAPWVSRIEDSVRGEAALRSLVAWAIRVCADTVEQCGAVRITRGALASHFGQSDGSSYSDIDRIRVNGPQSLQRYS
jgi:hypothetical protein